MSAPLVELPFSTDMIFFSRPWAFPKNHLVPSEIPNFKSNHFLVWNFGTIFFVLSPKFDILNEAGNFGLNLKLWMRPEILLPTLSFSVFEWSIFEPISTRNVGTKRGRKCFSTLPVKWGRNSSSPLWVSPFLEFYFEPKFQLKFWDVKRGRKSSTPIWVLPFRMSYFWAYLKPKFRHETRPEILLPDLRFPFLEF